MTDCMPGLPEVGGLPAVYPRIGWWTAQMLSMLAVVRPAAVISSLV